MLKRIETNVYNIPERLKEIDPGYFVVFNTETQAFEVHHTEQLGGTLALNIPYDTLDARTLELVRKTRVENAKKFYAEMEKHNEKLEQARYNKMRDDANQKTKELHRYASRKESRDVLPDEALKDF